MNYLPFATSELWQPAAWRTLRRFVAKAGQGPRPYAEMALEIIEKRQMARQATALAQADHGQLAAPQCAGPLLRSELPRA